MNNLVCLIKGHQPLQGSVDLVFIPKYSLQTYEGICSSCDQIIFVPEPDGHNDYVWEVIDND